MKAILTFNLPKEQEVWEIVNRALDMDSLLREIDHRCRETLKYQEPSKETEEILKEIREMIGKVIQ
jgi:hypothetical protein